MPAENGFGADPEGLRNAGDVFAEVGGSLLGIHSRAVQAITALGPAWGNDASGQKFGAGYVGAIQALLGGAGRGALDGLAHLIAETGVKVNDMAALTAQANEVTKQQANDLYRAGKALDPNGGGGTRRT